jgi:ribosome-associated protein
MFPTEKRQTPPEGAPPRPSKTERKRAMHELQALGEELCGVDPAWLAELALPESLADAIERARGITRHEARRRQLQFIGRLMRDVDPEPIRAALLRHRSGRR